MSKRFFQNHEVRNFRQIKPFSLFRSLEGNLVEAIQPDSSCLRELRDHRLNGAGTKFGCFLDDEVSFRLFHWRKQQCEMGCVCAHLFARLLDRDDNGRLALRGPELAQPLSVEAIECTKSVTRR